MSLNRPPGWTCRCGIWAPRSRAMLAAGLGVSRVLDLSFAPDLCLALAHDQLRACCGEARCVFSQPKTGSCFGTSPSRNICVWPLGGSTAVVGHQPKTGHLRVPQAQNLFAATKDWFIVVTHPRRDTCVFLVVERADAFGFGHVLYLLNLGKSWFARDSRELLMFHFLFQFGCQCC